MSAVAPPFPLASNAVMPLRAAAERRGSDDFSPLWAGQNATGCKVISAAQLTRQAFAAGAILTMLADTMMPEAFEHGGSVAGLATCLGFASAFLLSRLG